MSFIDLKDGLYRTFLDSRERGVKENQIDLAKKCVDTGVHQERLDTHDRYIKLNFNELIALNEYPPLVTALNLLLQYITNLLPPNPPANWWSIFTRNTSFKVRLGSVKGAREILQKAGYTQTSGDSITFPEEARGAPNREDLSHLATELLLARVECEGIISQTYPNPKIQQSLGYTPQGYNEQQYNQRGYQPQDPHSQGNQRGDQFYPQEHQQRGGGGGGGGYNQSQYAHGHYYQGGYSQQQGHEYGRGAGDREYNEYQSSNQGYPGNNEYRSQDQSGYNQQGYDSPRSASDQPRSGWEPGYNQQGSSYDHPKSRYDQQDHNQWSSSSQQTQAYGQQSHDQQGSSNYDQHSTSQRYNQHGSGYNQPRSNYGQERYGYYQHDQRSPDESTGFENLPDRFPPSKLPGRAAQTADVSSAGPHDGRERYGYKQHDQRSPEESVGFQPPPDHYPPGNYSKPVVPSERSKPPSRAAQTTVISSSTGSRDPPPVSDWKRESDPFRKESSRRVSPEPSQGPDRSSGPQERNYSGSHSGSGPQSETHSKPSSGNQSEENSSIGDSVPSNPSKPATPISAAALRKKKMQEILEKAKKARASSNEDIDPPERSNSVPSTPVGPPVTGKFHTSTAPVHNTGAGSDPHKPASSSFDSIKEVDEDLCDNHPVNAHTLPSKPDGHRDYPFDHKRDSGPREEPIDWHESTWATRVPQPHDRPEPHIPSGYSRPPGPSSNEHNQGDSGATFNRGPNREPYERPPEHFDRGPNHGPYERPPEHFDRGPNREPYEKPPEHFDRGPNREPYERPPEPPRDPRRNLHKNDSTKREDEVGGAIGGAVGGEVRSSAVDQQYRKYKAEAEYFKSLSPERQKDLLEGKLKHKETITHLKPHYKGTDLYLYLQSYSLTENAQEAPPSADQLITMEERRGRGGGAAKLDPSVINDEIEEQKKRDKIKEDGQVFMYWLKECTPFGFSPEEVQIAIKHNPKNPLDYLQNKWVGIIKNAITGVKFAKCNEGRSYGIPSKNEIRLLLIECQGDLRATKSRCVENRKKKIDELFKKIGGRFKVSWADAVRALSETELDVDEAYYTVQRYGLKELYEYLMSDFSKVTEGKTEMEYLKDLIIERMKQKDSEDVYNSFLRMVTVECKLRTLEKAEILVKLLEKEEEDETEYPLKYYIDAAQDYATFEEALKFLHQPCPICTLEYPMNEMVVLPACGDSVCKNCFKQYFEIAIKEKSIKHFVCPICGEPDLGNADQMQEMYLELLVAMIKINLEKDVYELCQKKLTDFNLSKEKNFVWCPHEGCGAGFINDRDLKKLECPECKNLMCFSCKKKWEDQHEGISCDQFAQWKTANDPEAQKAGLAAILKENGIECPSCKFRYDLARGGCMHFHCTQCPHEFCSGCNNQYHKTADACGKEYCKTGPSKPLGLHAHHPRDCLFYLRDYSVDELQKLLNNNNVEYDTNPPEAQVADTKEKKAQGTPLVPIDKPEAPGPDGEEGAVPKPPVHVIDGEEIVLVCQVMLQKELPDGTFKDEPCLKSAPVGMAGLCQVHYKEYLINKINKEKLDPVDMYNVHQVKLILKREELEVPKEEDDEEEEHYKGRLVEIVKERIPIAKQNQDQAVQ